MFESGASRADVLLEEWEVVDVDDPRARLTDEDLAWLLAPVDDEVVAVAPADVATVLRDAESAPVTAELITRLWTVDPAVLSADERVSLAVAWHRVMAAAAARRAAAVAALDEVQVALPSVGLAAAALTAPQVAAALGLGMGGADTLVTTSVALASRLPATAAAAARGDLPWEKATTIAQHTAALSDEQARTVEDRVLPAAWRRPPSQHAAALRRAVDRVDPDGVDARRAQSRADVRLIVTHHGGGVGELFAQMPSEQLDVVWTAADATARHHKAAGDPRTLDQLRVAALVGWAEDALTRRAAADAAGPSSRHGRRADVPVIWDLTSLLGVTRHCGELAGSGATLPPTVIAEILARGLPVRRLLTDPDTGELLDLTPARCGWTLPTRDSAHPGSPHTLHLAVDTALRGALTNPDRADDGGPLAAACRAALDALTVTDPALAATLTDLLNYPVTADALDADPAARHPGAALAEFVTIRDRHPTNPAAGPTPATAGDLDHTTPYDRGGGTTRRNLTALTRRWHRLRTHAGWRVQRTPAGWIWTSPTGRTYRTTPHDYRLGP